MNEPIVVTAPLSVDVLKELFLKKERSIVVDYDQSPLKGEKLFSYLQSLNIEYDLKFGDAKYTMEALEAWLRSTTLRPCKCMEEMAIIVLGAYTNTPGCPITMACLPTDWVERNRKVLDRWTNLIASMPIYGQSTLVETDRSNLPDTYDDGLDLPPRCGINIAVLLHHPEFWLISQVNGTPTYFEQLFQDSCYNGDSLFKYWQTENNPIFILSLALTSPQFDPKNFVAALEEGEQHVTSV